MDSFAQLLRDARTCRRFDESRPVPPAVLRQIVDDVRITSCCVNRQPLRYYTVSTPAVCAQVFPHLKWAAALAWEGPSEGERPTGYIAICSTLPPSRNVYYDAGIAGQSMRWTPRTRALAAA